MRIYDRNSRAYCGRSLLCFPSCRNWIHKRRHRRAIRTCCGRTQKKCNLPNMVILSKPSQYPFRLLAPSLSLSRAAIRRSGRGNGRLNLYDEILRSSRQLKRVLVRTSNCYQACFTCSARSILQIFIHAAHLTQRTSRNTKMVES